ncbi:hypothetical protein F5882DRAFT_26264 [Hyaloscypha sp. PMI_1271]|nr:hypothetical protein F5882DRAFT_26264 [Hyaloscypha sp. PMI_1271]
MGIQSYCLTSMRYQWFATSGILFGVSEQKEWPPMFGDLKKVTSLCYVWGFFWHQSLRMIYSPPTLSRPRH